MPCRTARHKCQRSSAEDRSACLRCRNLGLDCVWVQSRRFGRPRKQVLAPPPSSSTATQQDVAAACAPWYAAGPDLHPVTVDLQQLDADMSGFWADLIPPTLGPSLAINNYLTPPLAVGMHGPLDVPSGLRFFRLATSDPLPWSVAAAAAVGLCDAALSSSCPSPSTPPGWRCLVLACAAYGHRTARSGPEGCDSLYQQAKLLFDEHTAPCDDGSDAMSALHLVEASTVLAKYAYGTSRLAECVQVLRAGASVAAAIGLDRIDAGDRTFARTHRRPDGAPRLALALLLAHSNASSCLDAVAVCDTASPCRLCLTNACRQSWWELHQCTAIIFAATSQAGPRDATVLSLDAAVLPPTWGEQYAVTDRFWRLRARTSAVLAEAVDPEVRRLANAEAESRLSVLETMLRALIAPTRDLIEAIDGTPAAGLVHLERSKARLAAMRGLLSLHAAQTSLHRLYWLPGPSPHEIISLSDDDDDDDGAMSSQSAPASSEKTFDADEQLSLLLRSITSMSENADAVIRLIEAMDQRAVAADAQLPLPLPASSAHVPRVRDCCPFFACVQVAAVFAKAIVLTAHVVKPGCVGAAHPNPGVPQLCTCQRGASDAGALVWPHMGSATPQQAKWMRLSSVQTMRSAQEMLQEATSVWPFASECKMAVEARRQSIPGIGGFSGLSYSLQGA